MIGQASFHLQTQKPKDDVKCNHYFAKHYGWHDNKHILCSIVHDTIIILQRKGNRLEYHNKLKNIKRRS